MTDNNILFGKVRESSVLRLSVLFLSFFILLAITSIISSLTVEQTDFSERTKLLISSSIQGVLVFLTPSILTAFFASNSPAKWLDLNNKVSFRNFVGVMIVYVLVSPAMNWLIAWNENIHFPEMFSGVESQFRAWEDSSKISTDIILNADNLSQIVSGVLIVGLLTAFCEEIFFRGSLQKIFLQSSVGTTSAVWFAALLFSVFHFQFFGFVPRLLMGVFFGYLLIWTRSLWVPVFAHFLNNSIVVVFSGIFSNEIQAQTIGNIGVVDSGFPVLAFTSVAATFVFFYFFRNYFFKTPASRWR